MYGWSLLAAGFAMLAGAEARAVTYYVSPTGNSNNNGSSGSPWREIRDALPHLDPGDLVLVADGSYLGFTMTSISGTAALPITIKATGQNAVVTVTNDRPDNRDTIKISFCNYVTIDGLTAFGAIRAGVRIDTSHYITVKNGVFGNNATWGIFTNHSNYTTLEGNECYGSVAEHGIYISNSSANATIRGNVSHHNKACGLHFNGDIGAGGGNGLIDNALVEKNVLHNNGANNGGGSAINMDGPRNCVIRNNLLYNNGSGGIALYRIDAAAGPSGVKVYNNTIDMPTAGRFAVVIRQSDQGAGKCVLRNNILKHANTGRGGIEYDSWTDVANTDSDYNILDRVTPNDGANIYTLAQWQGMGYEPHSLSATNAALFVNSGALDYHLANGSPAIGAGQASPTAPDDIEGNSRPTTGASDIGAYQKTEAPPGPTQTGLNGYVYSYYAKISAYQAYIATGNQKAYLAYLYAYYANNYAAQACYYTSGAERTQNYFLGYQYGYYAWYYSTQAAQQTGSPYATAAANYSKTGYLYLYYAYLGY